MIRTSLAAFLAGVLSLAITSCMVPPTRQRGVAVMPVDAYRNATLAQLAREHNGELESLALQLQNVRYRGTDKSMKEEIYRPTHLSFAAIAAGHYACMRGCHLEVFFGWKTDRSFRAHELFRRIVMPVLLEDLARVATNSPMLSGYMFAIDTQVVPYLEEYKDQFMSERMAPWGAKQIRAQKEAEEYIFLIPSAVARDFLGGRASREEVQVRSVAACNRREVIWGSFSGSLRGEGEAEAESASYIDVIYGKLGSEAFAGDFEGKSVRFRALFLGEFTHAEILRQQGVQTEGRVFLNHRAESYQAAESPFGSTDLALPDFALSLPKEKSDVVYELKRGDVVEIKGRTVGYRGMLGTARGLHVMADELTKVAPP